MKVRGDVERTSNQELVIDLTPDEVVEYERRDADGRTDLLNQLLREQAELEGYWDSDYSVSFSIDADG